MNKLEVPKYKLLETSRVKGADYNPPDRTAARKLKLLAKSMSEVGLLYPILVDPAHVVIDGHRRLAAARELGWETITAIIVESGNRDAIYASVNVTAAKMTGNETLGVWLKQPSAVSPRAGKLFAEMVGVLGRGVAKQLQEQGLSARVFQTACRIARYVGSDTSETKREAVRWLMETAVIGQAMKALESGVDAKRLLSAIRRNKPLLVVNDDAAAESA